MSGNAKVAVITGASAGIGLAAAKALAQQGWKVIGIGRDPARTEAAAAALREAVPGADITMLRGDLALMADASRLAGEVAALTDRIHLLANNAGGMISEPAQTKEGLEECFAGNHVGPFVLTNKLLPQLRKAAAESPAGTVRIVNTSSDGSEMIPALNWNDLEDPLKNSPGAAYCSAKLANVLFAKSLATRLAGDGITAYSFHPGTVASNFFTHVPAETAKYTAGLDKISPDEAAQTLLHLALKPVGELENGGYYYRCAPREANPFAHEPANADRLWDLTEKLVASVA